MKVGIITLLGHFNYGNRLQNYALQIFLQKYKNNVETIWYKEKTNFELSYKINLKTIIKFIINDGLYNEVRHLEK